MGDPPMLCIHKARLRLRAVEERTCLHHRCHIEWRRMEIKVISATGDVCRRASKRHISTEGNQSPKKSAIEKHDAYYIAPVLIGGCSVGKLQAITRRRLLKDRRAYRERP